MKPTGEEISKGFKIPANKTEYSLGTMESVFNALHEGVFIYDVQEKSLSMNPAALKMHGLKNLEDIQYSLTELLSRFEVLDTAGHLLSFDQWPFSQALRGESFSDLELIVRCKDPKWEKFWSFSGRTVLEQNGCPKLVIISIQDITQRKKTEQALRESEQEFRAFFDNEAVGNAQVNMEGRFIRVNDRMCEITGYSRDELLKMGPVDITHPDDRQKEKNGLSALMKGKAPAHSIEKRYIRKSGGVIWVQVKVGLVRNTEGKPLRTVATIQDITEAKKADR